MPIGNTRRCRAKLSSGGYFMLTEKTTVSVFHFRLKGVFSDGGEEAYRSAKQQRCQIDRQLQQSDA
jgi:hypothetical protein